MSSETDILNHRELLAVQGVVAGKTATVALLEAGYSKSVAETRQKAVLAKPKVQRAILRAMEEAGITEKLIARTMKEGLKARHSVYQDGKRVAQEPDHGNRHKFLKTALELRGDLERDAADEGDTWEAMLVRISARRAQSGEPNQ
jgi:hypothetical protein